jgi:hypothetical protein
MKEKNCGNCENWKHYETRRDGRVFGTCEMTPTCICCSDDQVFGANGGGTFLSTKDFFCKFWKPKN